MVSLARVMIFFQNGDLPVVTVRTKPLYRDTQKLPLCTFLREPTNQKL